MSQALQPNTLINKVPTTTPQLDFLLALFAPYLRVEQAACLLDDCSPEHVTDLVEEGKLRAIDIASADATKRSLRIYRYSVEHLIIRPHSPLTAVPVSHVIPHERPTLLRRELARLIQCTEQHISNLNLPGPRGGHDTRHRIYRDAVVEFLTAREISP
jgi:hypothetical protein